MKKLLKSNDGYSLLIAVAVLMIFSILGLTLMTLSSSGIVKNENRESIVQATDLADKGIEFAIGSLQKTLEEQIILTPMGKTEFGIFLESTLNASKFKCPSTGDDILDNIGFKIPGENNTETKVCIEKVEKILTNGIAEEKDLYKRIVSLKSIGYANGKKHVTRSQIILGTDAIPDQLRYAVSSNDGDLYFHGGVEVTGDIKSAANVHIIKKAFSGWSYDPTWHNSVALKMNPTVGSSSSKIILSDPNNKIYYYDGSKFKKGKDIEYKSPNNIYNINNQKEIRSLLTNSEKTNILSKNVPVDTIDVNSKVEAIYNENKFNHNLEGESIAGSTHNLKQSEDSITLVYDKVCTQSSYNGCKEYGLGKTHLKIENKSDIEIQGTYYINGDLTINSANVKSNAILYVNGNVNIRFSTLRELKSNSSLIIFASGSIFIANISEYSNSPSTIKGFFYSQNDMTLYGVGSNIKIIGGISARNLYLTALRGNVNNTNNTPSEETQLNSNSRLQIIYDENIIKQYTDFKRDEEEEFITSINPPETISRQ